MNAINEVIERFALNQVCSPICGKCISMLGRRFREADADTLNLMTETLCACGLGDFRANPRLLWLVALLDTGRYERFVNSIAKLAPYNREQAWEIIRLSHQIEGPCLFLKPHRMQRFKPRFHLHPTVAPLLFAAAIRPHQEAEDALELLDYFEPVAIDYPVLKQAFPAWQSELARREEKRRTTKLQEQADRLRREEQERVRSAQRAAEWAAAEARGLLGVMIAIRDAPPERDGDCPERWAKTSERELATLPQELLVQVVQTICRRRTTRIWNRLRSRIEHLLRSRAHSEDRRAGLAKLQELPLAEKLMAACASRWSLTFYPEDWAEAAVSSASQLPPSLRDAMLSKLARLHRRCIWRDVRTALLSQRSESLN